MNPAHWKSVVQIRRAYNAWLLRNIDPLCPHDEMIKLVLKANDLGAAK